MDGDGDDLMGEALDEFAALAEAEATAAEAELVGGETLEEVERSLEAARRAVAQIRERRSAEGEAGGGFPVGAPARGGLSVVAISASYKIALGLEQRERAVTLRTVRLSVHRVSEMAYRAPAGASSLVHAISRESKPAWTSTLHSSAMLRRTAGESSTRSG